MTFAHLFPDLPDSARVWIYAADTPLEGAMKDRLEAAIRPFLAAWSSHRRVVRGDATVIEDRFLVLAAWVDAGDLSGCGIDKSVHEIEALARKLGFGWHGALEVSWRSADGIRTGSRALFRQAIRDGEVDGTTTVYDTSLTDLSSLRVGNFARPAADSWHGRVFRLGSEPFGARIA